MKAKQNRAVELEAKAKMERFNELYDRGQYLLEVGEQEAVLRRTAGEANMQEVDCINDHLTKDEANHDKKQQKTRSLRMKEPQQEIPPYKHVKLVEPNEDSILKSKQEMQRLQFNLNTLQSEAQLHLLKLKAETCVKRMHLNKTKLENDELQYFLTESEPTEIDRHHVSTNETQLMEVIIDSLDVLPLRVILRELADIDIQE